MDRRVELTVAFSAEPVAVVVAGPVDVDREVSDPLDELGGDACDHAVQTGETSRSDAEVFERGERTQVGIPDRVATAIAAVCATNITKWWTLPTNPCSQSTSSGARTFQVIHRRSRPHRPEQRSARYSLRRPSLPSRSSPLEE